MTKKIKNKLSRLPQDRQLARRSLVQITIPEAFKWVHKSTRLEKWLTFISFAAVCLMRPERRVAFALSTIIRHCWLTPQDCFPYHNMFITLPVVWGERHQTDSCYITGKIWKYSWLFFFFNIQLNTAFVWNHIEYCVPFKRGREKKSGCISVHPPNRERGHVKNNTDHIQSHVQRELAHICPNLKCLRLTSYKVQLL